MSAPVASVVTVLTLIGGDAPGSSWDYFMSDPMNAIGSLLAVAFMALFMSPIIMLWIAPVALVPAILSIIVATRLPETTRLPFLIVCGTATALVAWFVIVFDTDTGMLGGQFWQSLIGVIIGGAVGGYVFSRVWKTV